MGPEMGWQRLLEAVRRHHQFFDREMADQVRAYCLTGKRIHCGKGCRGCCNLAVNCIYTEAIGVAATLTGEQSERVRSHGDRMLHCIAEATDFKSYLKIQRQVIGYCPLLAVDGSCGIYDHRPFSCRSLLSTMESSWCEVDFSLLGSADKEAFMASLDRPAVTFPMHYLAAGQLLGQQLESEAALAMAAQFGIMLSGNLPFLVYLEQEHALSTIIPQGYAATMDFLRQAGLFNPYLLQAEQI